MAHVDSLRDPVTWGTPAADCRVSVWVGHSEGGKERRVCPTGSPRGRGRQSLGLHGAGMRADI